MYSIPEVMGGREARVKIKPEYVPPLLGDAHNISWYVRLRLVPGENL